MIGRNNQEQFGAIRGCPWPRAALRRFLLYEVFLHEFGYLQVVDAEAKTERRGSVCDWTWLKTSAFRDHIGANSHLSGKLAEKLGENLQKRAENGAKWRFFGV